MADHVMPVTRSSFQRFADRGFGAGPDRPQFLSGVAAPDPPALPELEATKRHENRLPVCKAGGGRLEDDAKEGDTVCQVSFSLHNSSAAAVPTLLAGPDLLLVGTDSFACCVGRCVQKFRWALFSEWISRGDPI